MEAFENRLGSYHCHFHLRHCVTPPPAEDMKWYYLQLRRGSSRPDNERKQELMDNEIHHFNRSFGCLIMEMIPIKKGGSDRSFFRICLRESVQFYFMHYGSDIAENFTGRACNKFLSGINISVPQIIAQDSRQHFIPSGRLRRYWFVVAGSSALE